MARVKVWDLISGAGHDADLYVTYRTKSGGISETWLDSAQVTYDSALGRVYFNITWDQDTDPEPPRADVWLFTIRDIVENEDVFETTDLEAVTEWLKNKNLKRFRVCRNSPHATSITAEQFIKEKENDPN